MPLNPSTPAFIASRSRSCPRSTGAHGSSGHEEHGRHRVAVKNASSRPRSCWRYAMSLPVATTISGMDTLEVLHQNLRLCGGSADDGQRDGRLRARLARPRLRRTVTTLQGGRCGTISDNPFAARLPRRSNSKRSHGDVGKGRRPLAGAVDERCRCHSVGSMGKWQNTTNQAASPAAPDVDRRRFLQAGLTGTGAIGCGVTDAQLCRSRGDPASNDQHRPDQFLVSRSEGPANRSRSSDFAGITLNSSLAR